MIRRELAGGGWHFEGHNIAKWYLEWEMGTAAFAIRPFEQALRLAKGQSESALTDLWEEAERTYVDLGLQAKYAD